MALTPRPSVTSAGNSGTTATVTRPTGVAAGDLLVALCACDSDGAVTAFTGASGWSQSGADIAPTSGLRFRMFTKVATGAEPTSYSFGTPSASLSDAVVVVSAWPSAGSIQVGPAFQSATSGTALTAPSVTATAAGALVTVFVGESAGTFTEPTGMTEIIDVCPTGWIALAADYVNVPAGATGARSSTHSVGSSWLGVSFVINEAVTTSTVEASDAFAVADEAYTIQPADAADTITVTDEGIAGQITTAAEAAGLSESVETSASLTASEPVGVGESVGTTANLDAGTDAVSFADSQQIIIPRSDSATVDEQVSLRANLAIAEQIGVAEGVSIETLYGDLVISLFAVHPTSGSLVPLPDFTRLTLSPQRNSAGSITLDYPTEGLNFDLLRVTITGDRDLEIEIWSIGSTTRALRGYLQEASGDDVAEGKTWTFAGGFLELRMGEAVVFPQPLTGVPSLGDEVEVDYGSIPQAKWDQLLALGYTGRANDGAERLYVPQLVLDAVLAGQPVPVLADPKRELKFSAVTPGELVSFILTQARTRGALTDIEWDFTASKDSEGNTWPTVLSTKWSPGGKYDDILNKLVNLDLAEWSLEWTGSKRVLRMFVPEGRGTDLTVGNRPVVLRRGRNLLEAPRKWSVRESGTTVLAAGAEGVYQTASDADAQTRRGRRIERFASANNLTTDSAVQAFAQNQLKYTKQGLLEVTHGLGFLPGEPRPLIAFDVGDWVYSQTGTSMERLRVVQWTLTVDAGQNPSGTVTLNDTVMDALTRLKGKLEAIQSGDTVVGTSEESQQQDTGVPSAPEGVVVGSTAYLVEGVAHSLVTVGWNAVTTNVDGTAATDLQGYKVQHKYDVGGGWVDSADVGPNSNTATFDADPGVQLTARVAAYDRNGNVSPWSEEVSHTTEDDTTPPPAPSTPAVSNYLGVIKIGWDGNSAAGTEMKLAAPDFEWCEVHLSQGSNFTPDASTMVGQLYGVGEWVVADLPYGTTQFARLVAVDTRGNRSDPSGQGSAAPEKVVSDDVFDGAIGTAKLADAAITTAKIDNLAVNDAKVGDLSVGKLTAGLLKASMVMTTGGMITSRASGTGNGVDIDSAGVRLYNSSGTLMVRLQTSDGSALVTGTYQSGLVGERINILPDGTMRLYPASGSNYALITNNEGAGSGQRITFRGAMDGSSRAGHVNLQPTGAGIFYGRIDATGPSDPNMISSVSMTGSTLVTRSAMQWHRLDGQQSPDSFGRRVEFITTDSSGNDIFDSQLWYKLRSSGGPMLVSPPNNAGIVLNDSVVIATTGDGLNYQNFYCLNLTQTSSLNAKERVSAVTFRDGRTALDVIRGAPARDWYYREEGYRPAKPGSAVQRRKKAPDGTDLLDKNGQPVFEEHELEWTTEPKAKQKHRGPIAEDLQAIDPDLVTREPLHGQLAVNLHDLIGVLWKAVEELADRVDNPKPSPRKAA